MICAELTGNRKKWMIKNFHGNNLDTISAPAGGTSGNRALEGNEATGDTPSEPTLITSYTQISSSVIISSGTADAVDWAGRKTALAYQLAKSSKSIKRDMEAMLVGNTGNSAGKGHTAPMCGNVH